MALGDYLRKRNFKKTPEPKGGGSQPDSSGRNIAFPTRGEPAVLRADRFRQKSRAKDPTLHFVVQEHHASRLHYDFRLELDGVLKSWAIPKGPSLNPHDRHLAIMTEDHPLEYRHFEGAIPEGNYGAGNVIIWDQGTYQARKPGNDAIKELRKELKKGHITFIVHGKKLKGEFALIKLHGDDPKAWLLIKKGDEFASAQDVTAKDESVVSGKKVDELGGKKLNSSDYPKIGKPWAVSPMLATLVGEPFSKDGWLFELKWDGYRAIASKHGNDFALYSRNHQNFSEKFAPVFEALSELKRDVMLDGEIVVIDQDGRPRFEWLQNYRKQPQGTLTYYAFDIMWCDGRDVRTMPLLQRKQLLKSVLPKSNLIRYSDHFEANGQKLFEQARSHGLEGIIAKNANSPYREAIRGPDWQKIKTHQRQEVVIAGYTEPRGGRKYIGSLLVGVYEKGQLIYVGHSGGGIGDDQRKLLLKKLQRIERKTSSFVITPKPNAPVHWVRPELVCEMEFAEWTKEGYMRQPEFKGLREDKKPHDVKRERVIKTASDQHNKKSSDKVEFTHLDKIFFPQLGYTKGHVINYYRTVADYILPYLKDRPHSLYRQPGGIGDEGFFQKNMEHAPAWAKTIDIYSESNKANLHWLVGGSLDMLLYMVQLGCIEINPWNSRIKNLEKPDWAVIDLDPEGVTFASVIKVARTVKEVCDEWDIACYPKTSGKTGLHIYIPLGAKYSNEQAKDFVHLIVIEVNKRQPKLTSIERMPEKRRHKIYLDYLQNREGQTLAAPYSLRPTKDASVSTPLEWHEVNNKLKPSNFTMQNIPKRLKKTGDLWKPVLGKGVDLKKILAKMSQQK
jgi:bifunctional non-homologous end joining protein LigD